TVADQGCGVAAQDRERVFDRFWRGKGPKTEGAGLGLAIVKETMKAHGGDVTVSDNAGGGALFTLLFASSENAVPAPHPGGATARRNLPATIVHIAAAAPMEDRSSSRWNETATGAAPPMLEPQSSNE